MLFALALPRTPKSVQADKHGLRKYRKEIKDAAAAKFQNAPSDRDWLYIRIILFTWKKGGPDIDNIIKPIVDALKGVVYRDDKQISHCLSTRIDLEKPNNIPSDNISSDLYKELIDMINAKRSDVLYIEVGANSSQQAMFGLIEGGAQ
jgi:Holliday junction resolvase RusA-like endonuclease